MARPKRSSYDPVGAESTDIGTGGWGGRLPSSIGSIAASGTVLTRTGPTDGNPTTGPVAERTRTLVSGQTGIAPGRVRFSSQRAASFKLGSVPYTTEFNISNSHV
jgi:hypothetical protein